MKLLHSAVGLFGTASAFTTVDSAMAGAPRTCKPANGTGEHVKSAITSIGHDMGSGGAGGIASSAKQHDVTVIKGLGIGAVGHHQSQSFRSPPACPLDIAAA